MPHDPVTISTHKVEKDTFGAHDIVVEKKYEAPASADGGIANDPYREKDAELAELMMKWLHRHYPGHLWGCVADTRQGIVKFNIPILMGFQTWWVVNLRTHDIVEGMREGAGQILERYGLRRGRFELASFLDARMKHSKLVMPSRKVPE